MKLFLRTNVSGLFAATIQGTLETADLGPEIDRRATKFLHPDTLAGVSGGGDSQQTDADEFELRLGDAETTYAISGRDDSAGREVLDLLYELRKELIRRRQTGRAGRLVASA